MRGSHVAHALHRPHPFCPAYPLDGSPETLGEREAWQAEWKWDGVRVQLIVRDGAITLWSRGEELVSDRFPEIAAAAHRLAPGTVLDGEVVAWRAGEAHPAPFALLRRRLAPRAPAGTTLRAVPVRMIAYDILESAGADLRGQPLHARRRELERVVGAMDSAHVCVSPVLQHPTWRALSEARSHAREQNVEGIMLKAIDDAYAAGHTGCRWWKWQSEPHHIDAVLLYARPGSGRRAGVLADYTFGVWHEESLVPFAAASSGLADDEIREIDAWIRGHTIDRFGPVRHVEPVQVFELAFAAIELSQRHKSGVAVRLPRIARWRRDKRAHDAGTLDTLRALAGGSAQ